MPTHGFENNATFFFYVGDGLGEKKVVFAVTCPKNWVSRCVFFFFFFFFQKRDFIAIISVCR